MGAQDWLSTAPKWHSPTPAATVAIDPTISLYQIWSPGEAETVNMTSPGLPGQELTLMIVAASSTSRVITLGTFFANAAVFGTGNVAGARQCLTFISNGIDWTLKSAESSAGVGGIGSGAMMNQRVNFVENATNTTHTGTVTLPAGSWLHGIQVTSSVLWTGGTAVMKVGDSVDDDGYFIGVDLKATDLLVGEVLDTAEPSNWGGKNGAYLVAATGQRGPVATNFGCYYAAGSNIVGVVTVGTPATTAGRTFMNVCYSVGNIVAAVSAGP